MTPHVTGVIQKLHLLSVADIFLPVCQLKPLPVIVALCSQAFFFFFFNLPRRISRLQFDVSVWSLANANHKNRVGAARRRNPEGLINMSLKKNNERKNELMNRNVIEGVDKK